MTDKSNPKVEKRSIFRNQIAPEVEFFARISGADLNALVPVLDFHFESIRINFEMNDKVGPIKELEIFYGKTKICSIENPKFIRNSENQTAVFSLSADPGNRGIRTKERLLVKDVLRPTIIGHDPIKIDHVVNFSVLDISATGMQLNTSLSNRHLIKGLVFNNCSMLLPGIGIVSVTLKIVRSRLWNDRLNLGATYQGATNRDIERIAQFALFGTLPPTGDSIENKFAYIKNNFIELKKLESSIKVEAVKSISEYEQVLKLRYRSYLDAKKVEPGTTFQDMADSYDSHSVIINAVCDGAVVGTIRLVYCRQSTESFPFEKYYKYEDITTLGERTSHYEISRLAVDPRFQGTDILIRLMKEVAKITSMKDGMTDVCLATNKLKKLYKRLGFYEIALPVPHPTLKNEVLTLLKIDPSEFQSGSRMSSLAWKTVAKDVIENLEFSGLAKRSSKNRFKEFKATLQKIAVDLMKNRKNRRPPLLP